MLFVPITLVCTSALVWMDTLGTALIVEVNNDACRVTIMMKIEIIMRMIKKLRMITSIKIMTVLIIMIKWRIYAVITRDFVKRLRMKSNSIKPRRFGDDMSP